MPEIIVTRDRWGIAHASTSNAASAFAAQGYCAAADRIWQMEYDRLKANGRWAEVVGSSAVREDKLARRLGIASAARRDWERLSEATKEMTVAYSSGVNVWLDTHHQQLPAEFEHHPFAPAPWEPWHCVAVYKIRHLFMGTMMRKLWRGAVVKAAGAEVALAMKDGLNASAPIDHPAPGIDLLEDAAAVLSIAAADLAAVPDVDGASNSWAVHGSRTASGKPLLAGDPHRGIEFPNVYLQFHMACDEFDTIGLSFPGVPGFAHFGHNQGVAWCITHAMADDTDVFVEQIDDIVDRRTERIEVRDSDPVDITTGSSPRGPHVLGEFESDHVLCANWTGLNDDTTFNCLLPMLHASTCDQLEEAVRHWVIPANNLLTADTTGDISFKIRGRIIERPSANRWTPVRGSDESSWAGLSEVPHEDLQHWRNPDRGFLVTANNRVSDHGPYISLDFAPSARHNRIVELLADLTGATVNDMTQIHGDVRSLVAPPICEIIAGLQPASDLGVAARDLVGAWDHNLTADSAAAVVYAAFRQLWARNVEDRLLLANPSFGEPGWPRAVESSRMLFEGASTLLVEGGWRHLPGLDSEGTLDDLLADLLDRAAAEIAAKHGDDPGQWRWDTDHVMASPHPLASAWGPASDLHPPVSGTAGDGDTVRAASVTPEYGLRAYSSSVARYVFDVGDWDNSGWVVPHGVSGERHGGHDLDQRQTWLDCELLPMAYSATAVASVAVSTETVIL